MDAIVQLQYPNVQGVCTGAIFSSYQRNRVENVCVEADVEVG